MSIQQISGFYLTNCGTLGTALSPFIVNEDGTVMVAAQRLTAAFDPATNMIGVNGIHLDGSIYEMQLNFSAAGDGWQLSGTVINHSNGTQQPCTGSREAGYQPPTLENTYSCSDAFEPGDTIYISTAQGPSILVNAQGVLQTNSGGGKGVPFAPSWNVSKFGSSTGIGLLANGTAPVGLTSDSLWRTLPGVSPQSLPYPLDFRLTDRGTVVINWTNPGSGASYFWDADAQGMITAAEVNALAPPIEFLIDIMPVPQEELMRRWSIDANVVLDACDKAKLTLVWQLTVGFFSALGLGPYMRGGDPQPGLLKMLDSNGTVSATLTGIWTAIKADPHMSVPSLALLGAKLLHAIYDAGLLWRVVKLAMNFAAWQIIFYLVAYILEFVLLAEAIIARLLASFVVWASGLVKAALGVSEACTAQPVPAGPQAA